MSIARRPKKRLRVSESLSHQKPSQKRKKIRQKIDRFRFQSSSSKINKKIIKGLFVYMYVDARGNRTPNLSIWSRTRYHCATTSLQRRYVEIYCKIVFNALRCPQGPEIMQKCSGNCEHGIHRPGIEPGSLPWQGSILPLDQRCWKGSNAFSVR